MNIELNSSTVSLPQDGLIGLRDAAGTRVVCVDGVVWITEDHEQGDVVLEAGQNLTIRHAGLTLITALRPASVQLTQRRERLGARIAGWLSRLRLADPRPATC